MNWQRFFLWDYLYEYADGVMQTFYPAVCRESSFVVNVYSWPLRGDLWTFS